MLNTLEKLVNRALSMDPESLQAVTGLAGRSLALEIYGHDLSITLIPGSDGIRLVRDSQEDADVIVRGTPVNLVAFAIASSEAGEGFTGKLEIIGDVGLAQKYQSIARNLDLDFEEHLSHWTGDLLARKLGNLARSTRHFARDSGRILVRDISEYLRYERDVLPDQYEVDRYVSEIDRLRDDTERLKVRIDRLADITNNCI